MPLDRIATARLYYDTTATDPPEDVELVRERLASLADSVGFELTETDVASLDRDRVSELTRDVKGRIGDEKPYVVDNRVLTPTVFGTVRPVLVIEYADDTPIDVYPHRDDAISRLPIGVTHFLDDVEEGTDTERGDFWSIHDDATTTDDADGGTTEKTASPNRRLLELLKSTVPSVTSPLS